MKKLSISRSRSLVAIAATIPLCLFSGVANAVTTLTFADNTSPSATFPATGTVGSAGFTQIPPGDLFAPNEWPEFRVVSAGGAVSGGGEKTIIPPTGPAVEWVYADDLHLTAVNNSQITAGVNAIPHASGTPTVATVANVGGTGLFHNAEFIFPGGYFGFLAPTEGSAAGNGYGVGTISVDVAGGTMTAIMPVAEAQWAGNPFPLGIQDDGVNGDKITFNGALSNVQIDVPSAGLATFNFRMTANHIIGPYGIEDSAGFAGQTTQWELVGSGVAPIVATNPPTAATGALVSTLPGTTRNDGRITQTELDDPAIYNAVPDLDADQTCVGGCFGFTVNGIAVASETVTLPLSASIPANAQYRLYVNGVWVAFDETVDTIMSGPGAQGDCSGPVVYAPGLNEGDFCVQLTIADGGSNDSDSAANNTIVTLGGVGVVAGSQADILIPASSINDVSGCSAGISSVKLTDRSEWLVLAAFIGMLGFRKFRRS